MHSPEARGTCFGILEGGKWDMGTKGKKEKRILLTPAHQKKKKNQCSPFTWGTNVFDKYMLKASLE